MEISFDLRCLQNWECEKSQCKCQWLSTNFKIDEIARIHEPEAQRTETCVWSLSSLNEKFVHWLWRHTSEKKAEKHSCANKNACEKKFSHKKRKKKIAYEKRMIKLFQKKRLKKRGKCSTNKMYINWMRINNYMNKNWLQFVVAQSFFCCRSSSMWLLFVYNLWMKSVLSSFSFFGLLCGTFLNKRTILARSYIHQWMIWKRESDKEEQIASNVSLRVSFESSIISFTKNNIASDLNCLYKHWILPVDIHSRAFACG